MSSINIDVLNSLCEAARSNSKSLQQVVSKPYDFDSIVRKLKFMNHFVIKSDKQTKNTTTKADKIRMENTKKLIEIDVEWLNAQYESKNMTPNFRNWKFVESKFLSMLIWGQKIALSITEVAKQYWYDCLMSIACAAKEFGVEIVASPNTTIEADSVGRSSSTIEAIYRHVYALLSSQCTITELFIDHSEMIITNAYNKMYPSKVIKPYPAQQKIIELMLNSLKNDTPMFLQYSTETGSGKTYSALACAEAHKLFTSAIQRKDNTFIFVCYNKVVRQMIWELCNSIAIPACNVEYDGFRIYNDERITGVFNLNSSAINDKGVSMGGSGGNGGYDEEGKKRKAGGNVRTRRLNGIAVIKKKWAEFDSLTKSGSFQTNIENQYKYLANISDHSFSFCAAFPQVFIADPKSAEVLVRIAPNSTVFIDEPDVDDQELAMHYANIIALCPKRIIVASATVGDLSDEMKKFQASWNIPCITEAIRSGTSGIHITLSSKGKIYLPHMAASPLSYERFLESLRETSFIKFYSPLAIAKMLQNLGKENKLNSLNFYDVSYENLRKFILEFFHSLDQNDRQKLQAQSQSLEWNKIEKPFTVNEHNLAGQTLVINKTPFIQAKAWEDGLFNVLPDGNTYDLSVARKKFLDEMSVYEATRDAILKNSGSKNIHRAGEAWAVVEQKLAEHSKTKPSLEFPAESILGSVAHRKRFAKHAVNKSISRIINVDEKLYANTDIELLQWLMAGVGFYDNIYHKHYNDAVLKLVSEHSLASFLSTPELIRGMDHRFENVMLNPDFTNTASYSALRQAVGRVGRPGSNWGSVIIDDIKAIHKLLDPESSIREVSLFKQACLNVVFRKKITPIIKAEKFKIVKSKPVVDDSESESEVEDLDSWEQAVETGKPKSKPISKPKHDDDEW